MADEARKRYARLTRDSRKELFNLLNDGFTKASLRTLVSIGIGEDHEQVMNDGLLGSQIGEVIAWTEKRGRIGELVAAAQDQVPDNENVQQFEEAYRRETVFSRATTAIGSWRRVTKAVTALSTIIGLIVGVWTLINLASGDNRPPVLEIRDPVIAISGDPLIIDLLEGVTDDGGLDQLTARPVSSITDAGGTAIEVGDGRKVEYRAPAGVPAGIDSFQYNVTDGAGIPTTGQITVNLIPGAMGQGLNIAIAQLTPTSEEAEGIALAATLEIERQVNLALEASGLDASQYEVLGPETLGPLGVDGRSPADLTARLNANVLIFGTATSGGTSSLFEVSFFLASSPLTGADELAGEYSFDPLDLAAVNALAVRIEVERGLGPSIVALVEFSRGLPFYQANQYALAEGHLLTAAEQWPVTADSFNGKEAILQLLGNVKGEQAKRSPLDLREKVLIDARNFYTEALEIGENTARAEFGLAETNFLLAAGEVCGWQGTTDPSVLEASMASFENLRTVESPPQAFLPARADLEIGKIAICLTLYANSLDPPDTQAISDHLATILSTATRLIEEEGDNETLKDLIGEAHQQLGFYHTAKTDYDAAVGEYLQAIDLTQEEERKARFNHALAGIYKCNLVDEASAARHYRESDRLFVLVGLEPLGQREC